MTHGYHPVASERHLLAPRCEDCATRSLGALDDAHLMAVAGVTREELERALPPWFVEPLLSINAMSVQAARLRHTGEPWPREEAEEEDQL